MNRVEHHHHIPMLPGHLGVIDVMNEPFPRIRLSGRKNDPSVLDMAWLSGKPQIHHCEVHAEFVGFSSVQIFVFLSDEEDGFSVEEGFEGVDHFEVWALPDEVCLILGA